MVTDDKKKNPEAPPAGEPSQNAGSDADNAHDPQPGSVSDVEPAANPAEPDVQLVETPATEASGKKDASAAEAAQGDQPHQIDPKELISRLADKNNVIMELTRENQRLTNEAKSLQDKVLRSAAEFDNFRKRSRKEWDLLKQQTKADVILEVLNVVDDFERAFSVVGERDDDFVQGIRLIHDNLVGTLEKLGVTRIEAHHAPFDPNYHMAVHQVDSDDVAQGHVVEVVQEGYTLDDMVIRPARVVIAK